MRYNPYTTIEMGWVIGVVFISIILCILLFSVVTDCSSNRIYNWVICVGSVLGCFRQIYVHGLKGIFVFFISFAIPILLLFVLFMFQMLGAGDIKLLAVLGGFFGFPDVLYCIGFSFLIGAFFAFFKLIQYHNLFYRLQYLAEFISTFLKTGKIEAYYLEEQGAEYVVHFAIPIFLGTIIYLGVLY